jgi:hypothetical protein
MDELGVLPVSFLPKKKFKNGITVTPKHKKAKQMLQVSLTDRINTAEQRAYLVLYPTNYQLIGSAKI